MSSSQPPPEMISLVQLYKECSRILISFFITRYCPSLNFPLSILPPLALHHFSQLYKVYGRTQMQNGEYNFSWFLLPSPHSLLTLPLLLSSTYLLLSSHTMITNLIFSPSTLPPLHPVNSLLHVSLLVQLGHLFKLPPVNLQKKYLSDKNPKKQNQPPPWRPSTFRRHLGLCLPLHVHSPW